MYVHCRFNAAEMWNESHRVNQLIKQNNRAGKEGINAYTEEVKNAIRDALPKIPMEDSETLPKVRVVSCRSRHVCT